MTLSLAKPKLSPPRILIFGPEGLGKTTFGTQADKPVFIPVENGLVAFPDVAQFPQPTTYDQFMKYLEEVAFSDHEYKTLVIDSLDWLESLFLEQICKVERVQNIEEACGGFGKWVPASVNLWRDYLKKIDYINQEKQMTIIQIAHAQIKPYNGPDIQTYDRFSIKLHESKQGNGAAPLLFEHSDIVLFANYFTGITKDALPGSTKKAPKERTRGIGSGERVLYTEERPAFRCKNRFGLPEQIPFTQDGSYWQVIADHVPYYKNQQPKGQ